MQPHLRFSNPQDAILVHSAVASADVLAISSLLYLNCQTGTWSLTSKEGFINSLFINLQHFLSGYWRHKKAGQSVEGEKRRSLGFNVWLVKRLVVDVSWWHQRRRRRGRRLDKRPGLGLCHHSGSKVPSGLYSPWYQCCNKWPICIHGRKHKNNVTYGDNGAALESSAQHQQ